MVEPTRPYIVWFNEDEEFEIQFEGKTIRLPMRILNFLDEKIGQFTNFIYEEVGLTDLDGSKIVLKRPE